MDEFKIRQLNKSNYDIWSRQIEIAFRAYKIDHLLKSNLDASIEVKDQDEGRGLCIINSSLSDEGIRFIRNVQTSKEAVDQLRSLYGQEENKWELDGELHSLRWKEGQSAEVFISKLNEIRA